VDFAHFYDVPPVLSKTLLDRACQSYFVEGNAPGKGVEGGVVSLIAISRVRLLSNRATTVSEARPRNS
jgi:hypothetical protein